MQVTLLGSSDHIEVEIVRQLQTDQCCLIGGYCREQFGLLMPEAAHLRGSWSPVRAGGICSQSSCMQTAGSHKHLSYLLVMYGIASFTEPVGDGSTCSKIETDSSFQKYFCIFLQPSTLCGFWIQDPGKRKIKILKNESSVPREERLHIQVQ